MSFTMTTCLNSFWNNPLGWRRTNEVQLIRLIHAALLVLKHVVNIFMQCSVQDYRTKIMMGSMSFYFILRMAQLNFANSLIEMVQQILPSVVQTFGAASLPFACASNSLNKPRPLHLDVSLPSIQDIRWSFARLLYLLDVQFEKNVAT